MKKIGHSAWVLIKLYFFLLVLIDHSTSASDHILREELNFIHQEIGLLRNENHHPNMEIALMKEKIGIHNINDSSDQRITVASLDDNNHRNKRPVRLLPPHILYGERRNETDHQKQVNRRRYGQPTNCSDLSILGYTLNGFYLVKSNESSTEQSNIDIKLETVFCAFKQPDGTFNPTLVEKRIISRRETNKPSNDKILIYFHGTGINDLELPGRNDWILNVDNHVSKDHC